ncbi:hypothetical protein D3C75_504540 [compost metagenome]
MQQLRDFLVGRHVQRIGKGGEPLAIQRQPGLALGGPAPALGAIGCHGQQGDTTERQHIDPALGTIQRQLGGIGIHPAAVFGFDLVGLQQLAELLRLAHVRPGQGHLQLLDPRQTVLLAQGNVILHQLFQIRLHLQHQRDQALTGFLHRFQLLSQLAQLILLIGHQRLHVAVVGFQIPQLQLGILQLQPGGNGGIGRLFYALLGGFPIRDAVFQCGRDQIVCRGDEMNGQWQQGQTPDLFHGTQS